MKGSPSQTVLCKKFNDENNLELCKESWQNLSGSYGRKCKTYVEIRNANEIKGGMYMCALVISFELAAAIEAACICKYVKGIRK